MSYALPILDSNGNTPRYGGEFQILYNAQLRGDQQNPVTVERDFNTGQKFTLYEPGPGPAPTLIGFALSLLLVPNPY